MKRILFISHDASLTGAPKSILLIAQNLKEIGYEIHWIVGKRGPRSKTFEQNQTEYWNISSEEKSIFQKILFKLKGGLKKHQHNIVEKTKKWSPDLIINNTIVNGEIVEILSHLNIPIITRIPEMHTVMQFFNTHNKSTEKTLLNSDLIIAACKDVQAQLISFWSVNPDKIKVFYSGTDIKPIFKVDKNKFIVSACGSLINRKGMDLFLNVAQKVIVQLNKTENIQFQWIGGNRSSLGYFEFMQDIFNLELSGKIIVTGEIEDISPFLSESSIFLMTSREDPFPIVNLEAAMHKLPIICFDKSGGSVDFANEGGGFIVPYLDTDLMAQKIIDLYQERNQLNIASQKAYETALNYTKERVLLDWSNLLKSYHSKKK